MLDEKPDFYNLKFLLAPPTCEDACNTTTNSAIPFDFYYIPFITIIFLKNSFHELNR